MTRLRHTMSSPAGRSAQLDFAKDLSRFEHGVV
jgi:hypothetical protein